MIFNVVGSLFLFCIISIVMGCLGLAAYETYKIIRMELKQR